MGPKMPVELSTPSLVTYSADSFKADLKGYRDAVAAKDLTQALALRNQIGYRVMGDIQSSYERFEMSLTTQRAGFETGSDTIQLGRSAATTVVGAGDVKELLAASMTAFQGTRLSYDKNFFREKTTESIISQMRATRKTRQAQLITSLATRDVASYPWDAVWIDLIDFYYAGTVPSALVEIANGAGAKADAATITLDNAVAALTPSTPAQAKMAATNRAAYAKLKAESKVAATSEAAKQRLQAILTAAKYFPAADASTDDLLAQLRKAIDETVLDNDKLVALYNAVTAAPIE